MLARLLFFVPSYLEAIGKLCQQYLSWVSICPYPFSFSCVDFSTYLGSPSTQGSLDSSKVGLALVMATAQENI